ncbi:GGDEF domain-containing protein [Butyrivibrio sp.]|uniref:GGDEF domain-containing protein n=1 Tax=Butyrivibrio sp. TaxID=28121 RepID=UPI0025B97629|nr:GGDEF domain-containing protein [Butyrivibrio sp.]MBQ9303361.1 GGDEF domain-containing protein [Butyrivibrio sp.]
MKIIENAKALWNLFKDYRSMNDDDLADFYQSKCDYYQNYVAISLVVGAFFSITYIFSDYLLNGTYLPTLIPRFSILIALALFLVLINFVRDSKLITFLDFALAHCIVLATMWAIYHLEIKVHASEGFIIMNVVFLTVGFVSRPRYTFLSSVIFILEILITNTFNHYPNLDIIFALQIPVGLAVVCSHILLTLYYLDHYRVRQKLELAMVTDPLTQVYNRHLLEKIVTKNALIDAQEPIAIAMLDIDYFKQVNDEHGHYTGDLTLLYIGKKLSTETHGDDYVIRFGGEEFIIIFKNCDVNNACARMEQFRRDIEAATDTPVPITVSVGVSKYMGDFSKSIQNVDSALYKAKNTGRNKVVVV